MRDKVKTAITSDSLIDIKTTHHFENCRSTRGNCDTQIKILVGLTMHRAYFRKSCTINGLSLLCTLYAIHKMGCSIDIPTHCDTTCKSTFIQALLSATLHAVEITHLHNTLYGALFVFKLTCTNVFINVSKNVSPLYVTELKCCF